MTPEQVLRLHIDGFIRAPKQQDFVALEAIYSDRYMLVRPDGSVLDKKQVLEDLHVRGLTFRTIDLENPSVRVFGSAAVLTAASRTVSSRKGKQAPAHFRLVAIYAQEPDAVRLVHFQSTTLADGPRSSTGGFCSKIRLSTLWTPPYSKACRICSLEWTRAQAYASWCSRARIPSSILPTLI